MSEQFYYGHGKLLLTGEYFVLDGAKSIALPTKLGQKMHVRYRPSNRPILFWKSFDEQEQCWLETKLELWHFKCIADNANDSRVIKLQDILRQARKQNIHFLRDDCDVYVETSLEFPLNWGLGSSSSLVYNIAQWAFVSPFELQTKTFNGSGYDIACAQSMGPISYQLKRGKPNWETIDLNPHFKNNIYFVYQGNKQNSHDAIIKYREMDIPNKELIISKLNKTSESMMECIDLNEFEQLIFEHENIMSNALGKPRIIDEYFSDYWGAIKSLGAWGGDFMLATSSKSMAETRDYFEKRGYSTILSFDELILQNFEKYGAVNSNEANEQKNVQL